MMFFKKISKDTRGQSMVEFALILPLLVLVLFGIIQFGFLLFNYINITHAVREGVRLAAVNWQNDEAIENRVYDRINASAYLDVSPANVELTWTTQFSDITEHPEYDDPDNLNPDKRYIGDEVTVAVNNASLSLLLPFFNSDIPLSSSATMRLEQAAPISPSNGGPGLSDIDIASVNYSMQGNTLKVDITIDPVIDRANVEVSIYRVFPDGERSVPFRANMEDRTNSSGVTSLNFTGFFNDDWEHFYEIFVEKVTATGYATGVPGGNNPVYISRVPLGPYTPE